MAKYIVDGGEKLSGRVKISGNKNAVLPCLSACLLTQEEVTLKNVPKIRDVEVLLEILKTLGAEVENNGSIVKVKAREIKTHILPQEQVTKLRASILLVGSLLSRVGKIEFCHPGGDVIGKRSIEAHIRGFEELGYKFKNGDREYKGTRSSNSETDKIIFLEEASVTATENLILASVLGNSKVILKNCAQEPHVVDLCRMLILMGAKISGIGTSTLDITGVKNLKGCEFTIGPEHIEIGTYAIAAAITRGEITLEGFSLENLEPVLMPLKKMGVLYKVNKDNTVTFYGENLVGIPKLIANIWPGFPSDLVSVFIVLATQARGVSLLHDWMYESRMFFVDKLISMGANITIADPHRVVVYGPTKLYGREVDTPDIRAGMACVLAALVAKGRSIINRAELIERGYEDVVGNLMKLGAKIERID